jgi:hypothetical protein
VTPALDARGNPREDAAPVETTDMPDLEGRPEGLRIIVRREPVHTKYARDLKPYEVATGLTAVDSVVGHSRSYSHSRE